jgi:2-methylisocitrate lyase-like PEP mutase family enzyme
MDRSPAAIQLVEALQQGNPQPFIGIYDAFSASLASRRFSTLFVSGFGFGASHYGLPDVGFIAWTDLLAFVNRLGRIAPAAQLLVDIDDGFGDAKVATHVAGALERAGAFGIVLEDQQRPRRCGHLGGKQVLPLEEYLRKLEAVLSRRDKLFVVARTDADGDEEVLRRVAAFEKAGADAVLADGIKNLDTLRRIRETVKCPVAFNQIAGGKSPHATLSELREIGATIIIYSTPCLFAAQKAIKQTLESLHQADGSLASLVESDPDLASCNSELEINLANSNGGNTSDR